jgi:hypothetical protein
VKQGTLAGPIGEAGQIRSANKKFSQIFFYLLCFAYWRSTNRRTNSIDAAEGKQMNSRSATPICCALPIVIKIAY